MYGGTRETPVSIKTTVNLDLISIGVVFYNRLFLYIRDVNERHTETHIMKWRDTKSKVYT